MNLNGAVDAKAQRRRDAKERKRALPAEGGSGDDLIRSLALGLRGEVYLVGSTPSDDSPVTDGALQRQHGGQGDAFLVKLVLAKPQ